MLSVFSILIMAVVTETAVTLKTKYIDFLVESFNFSLLFSKADGMYLFNLVTLKTISLLV